MAIFLKKMKIFGNFFEKKVKFLTIFFYIQMAIFRRVRCDGVRNIDIALFGQLQSQVSLAQTGVFPLSLNQIPQN